MSAPFTPEQEASIREIVAEIACKDAKRVAAILDAWDTLGDTPPDGPGPYVVVAKGGGKGAPADD